MKDWFDSLEQRERLVVAGGTLAVFVAVVYAFAWIPLDTGQQTMSASVSAWERSLAELKPLKGMQAAAGSGNTGRSVSNEQKTPVVIVDQTLRARGLDRSLKRSQPVAGNGIRVEFENVAFDDLVLWLGDLSTQYGMNVSSGSMSTTSQVGPGRINATFTLERA